MTIRLEQMHPALVHFPIALLPLSLGADIVAGMSGNKVLLSFGQQSACVAALGAAASVATGLVAGEEVNVEGESMDMLITHRNVNIVAAIIAGSTAIWRFGLRRPSAAYLLTGVIGIGLLTYSSSLGRNPATSGSANGHTLAPDFAFDGPPPGHRRSSRWGVGRQANMGS